MLTPTSGSEQKITRVHNPAYPCSCHVNHYPAGIETIVYCSVHFAGPALLAALFQMMVAYAPLSEETVRREGEQALHSAVREARDAIRRATEGA